MKFTFVGLLILLISNSVWATATPVQIKRAQAVLKQSFLPRQFALMTPEKLKTHLSEVTYDMLRAGDILRIAVDIKQFHRRTGNQYFDDQHEGFISLGDVTPELHKGDFIRILRKNKSNGVNFASKENFKGVSGKYIEVAEFAATKLDQNFEPIGEIFYLTALGGLDRKITDVERIHGGFMSQNPPLSFNRASMNDILVNAQAIDTGKGVLPAFSPVIITKTARTRIPWTISNYDYVLTAHLLNCPEQFQAQKCEIQIKGTKMYVDPNWIHYTMPENRRIIKFWGGELHY